MINSGHIAVVGGGIGGSAVSGVLARHGVEADVFEARATMQDEGYGVCLPAAVLERTRAGGLIEGGLRTIPVVWRSWVTADVRRASRTLWRQSLPAPVHALRWGDLWQALRDTAPGAVPAEHTSITAVAMAGDEVAVRDADGGLVRCMGVVGADGVDSVVRRDLFDGRAPEPAGYSNWRGTVEVASVSDLPEPLRSGDAVTVGFPGGHLVAYLIPGQGTRDLVNWVLYASGDEAYERALALLPLEWADLLAEAARVERRSVGDLQPDRMAVGSALLVGDAAAVTRPHTASGAAKALEDALALDEALARCATWNEAVARVDRVRGRATRGLVELGRRIGRDQVEQTPPWNEMTPATMAEWTSATISGDTSYLYRTTAAGGRR